MQRRGAIGIMGDRHDARRRAVIVSGGCLGEWVLEEIRPEDYVIGADSGADFLVSRGITPDMALGDFDSAAPDRLAAIRRIAKETASFDAIDKDWTDTELALREAVRRGFTDIRIAGGLGGRFDHSLANVHLLVQAWSNGCRAVLADANNEIRLCTDTCQIEADPKFPYISLLPLTPEVKGVTLSGFRYPLHNAVLRMGWSIGVSNVLESVSGTIQLSEGMLLVIRSRD